MSKKANSIGSAQLDGEDYDLVVGRIQLQEILDEVTSIEHRYSRHGEGARKEQSNTVAGFIRS